MSRLARDSDAAEIRQWLKDYGLDTTLAKLRLRRRSHPTFIEPGVGYAEVSLRPNDIQVSSIFPEGTPVELLKPSLDKCFQRAARTRAPDTPVWARFFGGKDANGKPDGGESKCRAWHRLYPNTIVAPPDTPGGLWEIRSTRGLGGLV